MLLSSCCFGDGAAAGVGVGAGAGKEDLSLPSLLMDVSAEGEGLVEDCWADLGDELGSRRAGDSRFNASRDGSAIFADFSVCLCLGPFRGVFLTKESCVLGRLLVLLLTREQKSRGRN